MLARVAVRHAYHARTGRVRWSRHAYCGATRGATVRCSQAICAGTPPARSHGRSAQADGRRRMSLFEVVVIVVAIICIPLAAVMHFPVRKLIDQVGRRGALWFDHSEDVPVRDQPSEDARDAPI